MLPLESEMKPDTAATSPDWSAHEMRRVAVAGVDSMLAG